MPTTLIPLILSTFLLCLCFPPPALAANSNTCLGDPSNPRLGAVCRVQTSQQNCLGRLSISTPTYTATCTWRQLLKSNTYIQQTQIFTSYAGGVIPPQKLSFNASAGIPTGVCGVTVNATLTNAAANYIKVFAQQRGPPNNKNNTLSGPLSPWVEVSSAACVGGLGADDSRVCATKLIPLPALNNVTSQNVVNTLDLAFTTADSGWITQFKQNATTPVPIVVSVKTKAYGCGVATPIGGGGGGGKGTNTSAPSGTTPGGPTALGVKPTPAISDKIIFGPSDFILYPGTAVKYTVTSFRAYLMTNVTGFTWNAKVVKALDGSSSGGGGGTSQLTVFAMREADFSAWAVSSTGVVDPPADLALNGTLCTGTYCKGSIPFRIGPGRGRIVLWVSWPRVWSPLWSGTVSSTGPIATSPYKTQLVQVDIDPATWNFKGL